MGATCWGFFFFFFFFFLVLGDLDSACFPGRYRAKIE
jgi:hypothetical protein